MAAPTTPYHWMRTQFRPTLRAAIATGISHVLGNVLQLAGLYYFVNIQPFRGTLWKPLAAAAASGGTAWFLFILLAAPSRWIVGIPAALLVYGGILLALGLSPRDQKIVDDLWDELRARLGS